MSNLFIPYVPGFVDLSSPPEPVHFETFSDLLTNEFLQRHMAFPGFERFEYAPDQFMLMSSHNSGYDWYVVGKVLPGLPDLPVWEAKYRPE